MKKKEKNNEERTCKKCGKVLPDDYKHKACEACRNKMAHGIKKGIKGVVMGVGLFALTKDKTKTK